MKKKDDTLFPDRNWLNIQKKTMLMQPLPESLAEPKDGPVKQTGNERLKNIRPLKKKDVENRLF